MATHAGRGAATWRLAVGMAVVVSVLFALAVIGR